MDPITSVQNPTIKLIRSLQEKKYRQETGLFLAEGRKVLARAQEKGWTAEYLIFREGEAAAEVEGAFPLAEVGGAIERRLRVRTTAGVAVTD